MLSLRGPAAGLLRRIKRPGWRPLFFLDVLLCSQSVRRVTAYKGFLDWAGAYLWHWWISSIVVDYECFQFFWRIAHPNTILRVHWSQLLLDASFHADLWVRCFVKFWLFSRIRRTLLRSFPIESCRCLLLLHSLLQYGACSRVKLLQRWRFSWIFDMQQWLDPIKFLPLFNSPVIKSWHRQ